MGLPHNMPVAERGHGEPRADGRAGGGHRMRHLHAPDETHRGGHGHGGVDGQGHRGDRRVDVDDAERILLLVVRRREDQAAI